MSSVARSKRQTRFYLDPWLVTTVVAILLLGLLMVASSSMVISDKQFGYPFHFLIRQTIYCGLACVIVWLTRHITLEVWQRYSAYFLIVTFVLLLLVLIPGIGRQVNGARRWIGLGPIGLQVSELAKLCAVIYMSSFLVRKKEEVQAQFIGFLKPMVLFSVMALLLLKEPDFGATVVVFTVVLSLLFLSGAKLWQFLLLMVIVIACFALLAISSPYRLLRLTTFMNPWAVQFNSGYQLTQSLMAFGRGGVFGVGLGNSIQKLFYLPEAHTDFLYAVLFEELGLIGGLAVIGLFATLVGRAFYLARRCFDQHREFAGFIAVGLGVWLGVQAMINIGVTSGVLPTKGLTLPMMSYGGSSLLINAIVISLLLRISHETTIVGDYTSGGSTIPKRGWRRLRVDNRRIRNREL